jgi:hypothetical protein
MARVKAEAEAGRIAPDDVDSQMELQGELAYREALNPDDTRPTDQQIDAWSSALHYKVLGLTRKPNSSCIESVRLEVPAEKPALETISESIRLHECAGVTPIVVNFYLPGMNENGYPWANAHLEPSTANSKPRFTVGIAATTPGQEASSGNPSAKSGEEIVGIWRDPATGFQTKIVKQDGRYYEDFSVEDPNHPLRNALEETSSPSGRKFVVAESDTAEYYIVTPDGSLKEYDHTGYIKTIPKMQ